MNLLIIKPLSFIVLLHASGFAQVSAQSNHERVKQSYFVVNSIPDGASVLVNDKLVGTTPCTYQYNLDDGKLIEIRLEKIDFEVSRLVLRPRERENELLVNALLFHIPRLISKRNSESYYFDKKEVTVQLYKLHKGKIANQFLPITDAKFEIATMGSLGKLNGSVLRAESKKGKEIYNPRTDFDPYIQRGFDGTWIDEVPFTIGTNQGQTWMEKTAYYLHPVVRSMDADLYRKKVSYDGSIKLVVDWEVWSTRNNIKPAVVLHREVNYVSYGEKSRDLLRLALEQGARMLADEDTLVKLLKGRSAAEILDEAVLDIQGVQATKFEQRKDMLSSQIKSVVTIKTSKGFGSGFFIDGNGHLITNEHVVNGQATITVVTNDGLEVEAKVIRQHPKADLALLQIAIKGHSALPLSQEEAIIGEDLYAIGTPMDDAFGQSVSRGILSGKRVIEERQFLQTDVSINPGNSGGPLLNEAGEVVGIATLKISEVGIEGLGFAIPIMDALRLLNINYIP